DRRRRGAAGAGGDVRHAHGASRRRTLTMRLRSIEPTPNPNNMKLNLEESLPQGERYAYTAAAPAAERAHYPVAIRRLLEIPGVKSLYHCLDFIAVQRVSSSADWQGILAQARGVLGD